MKFLYFPIFLRPLIKKPFLCHEINDMIDFMKKKAKNLAPYGASCFSYYISDIVVVLNYRLFMTT